MLKGASRYINVFVTVHKQDPSLFSKVPTDETIFNCIRSLASSVPTTKWRLDVYLFFWLFMYSNIYAILVRTDRGVSLDIIVCYCVELRVDFIHIFPWWRHKMETFSALLAFVRAIHRWPVDSPHKGQWRGALMCWWSASQQWLSKQWRHRWFETPSRSLWRRWYV